MTFTFSPLHCFYATIIEGGIYTWYIFFKPSFRCVLPPFLQKIVSKITPSQGVCHLECYAVPVRIIPLLEILEERHERGLRGGIDGAVVHAAVVHRACELRRLGWKRLNETER